MEFTPEGYKKYLEELRLLKEQDKKYKENRDKLLFNLHFKESLRRTVYKMIWFEQGPEAVEKFKKKSKL